MSTTNQIAKYGDPEFAAITHFKVLAEDKKDYAVACAYAKVIVPGVLKNMAGALNTIAWDLVDPKNGSTTPDLDLALRAATRAAEIRRDSDILDTLARVCFLRGDRETALKLGKEAYAKAPTQEVKDQMLPALKQYGLS